MIIHNQCGGKLVEFAPFHRTKESESPGCWSCDKCGTTLRGSMEFILNTWDTEIFDSEPERCPGPTHCGNPDCPCDGNGCAHHECSEHEISHWYKPREQ